MGEEAYLELSAKENLTPSERLELASYRLARDICLGGAYDQEQQEARRHLKSFAAAIIEVVREEAGAPDANEDFYKVCPRPDLSWMDLEKTEKRGRTKHEH